MEIPDPATEEWLAQAISNLIGEELAQAFAIVRARGGTQAELLEQLVRRREATEVADEASATVLDATVIDTDAPARGSSTVIEGPASGRRGELSVGTQFAGYMIEGVAGEGGMGIVYRARQLRPSRIVALKVISPQFAGDSDFRERFAHESEIAATIEHSNVIPVYDVGEESNLLYIAMRYVEGTDLRAVISAEGHLAPRRAVQLLAELTAALDAAHAHGLVHRDVKPGNVLIAREGQREHVYLTDFGLAKLAASAGRTRTGMFVGTLDYAAPEQIEGRRVDARTDVYAAGCLLYQMLTGSVPFPQEHEAAIMFAHISAEPRSMRELVPSLPAELDAVIARAMAKNPDHRYPSAGDLGRAAIAAATGERARLIERSVATGRAAPAGPAPTLPDRPSPDAPPAGSRPAGASRPRPGGRTAAIAAGALIIVVVAVIVLTSGSGGGGHGPNVTPPTSTTKASVPTPTTKTYANSALRVRFAYPATWSPLSLQGSPADFGIGQGAGETRCALEIERGAGPAGSSQEARFAFVRSRSAIAARSSKHYQLRAIQAEPNPHVAGVGLLRVADGQGGHLGFFFRGRDVYVFDCITPGAILAQTDRQAFVPLLASVRIG